MEVEGGGRVSAEEQGTTANWASVLRLLCNTTPVRALFANRKKRLVAHGVLVAASLAQRRHQRPITRNGSNRAHLETRGFPQMQLLNPRDGGFQHTDKIVKAA